MNLLRTLCQLAAPSGSEAPLTAFLLDYIRRQAPQWRVQPEVVAGEDFQDCIILVFGQPRTAVFAHIDSIGFTVRYGRQLVRIGGPAAETGYRLVGEDSQGPIECTLTVDDKTGALGYEFSRDIERGTTLTFACDFRETEESVQSCYLDNRLGVWNALRLCETLEDGIVVFSCYEEHGGGTVKFLAKHIYETYGVRQALVCDITWVTEGVHAGQGCAISLRDSLIPRRSYVERIRQIARQSGIPHQLEVEGSGGSDGKELQHGAQPWDWCFVGAPEDHVHTPNELVHKADIDSMLRLYRVLMQQL
ncbi:M20/M25/M40 family metallo-hydrolase [Hymenobacter busanensis]|uniref:M20/M25/M40 family metallo-hydrolase n=1 Tax=Hymenobacter busanensis TaxID=2607656 RepID=A0A7L4ZVZ1_9BACT|nr:M20/M25/M40 family metallo-hydrolase [Hymenobacter busanensis]KAA9332285.1 M20/M25/M40 family metallo-hydrolase [Hymenobacter busanensis]QHJ07378.1 M20/M25/M40 family metallo-hydrolase [Hymenobacter busanensis]